VVLPPPGDGGGGPPAGPVGTDWVTPGLTKTVNASRKLTSVPGISSFAIANKGSAAAKNPPGLLPKLATAKTLMDSGVLGGTDPLTALVGEVTQGTPPGNSRSPGLQARMAPTGESAWANAKPEPPPITLASTSAENITGTRDTPKATADVAPTSTS